MPECAAMPRNGAGLRMPSDGLALLPDLPAPPEALLRALGRLMSPMALVEGVDHRLARLALQPAQGAAFVMVLPPVTNLSTRFYRVHPRRNDRVLSVSAELTAMFPRVDFLRFDFTGHMRGALAAADPAAFALLLAELHRLWAERVQRCLSLLPPCGVLVQVPGAAEPPPLPAGLRVLALDPAAPQVQNLALLAEALDKSAP